MDEDRLSEDDTDRISRLERDLGDKISTLMARVSTFPTGTVMWTFANIAPSDTLLLQGQTVNRAGPTGYPALWDWITQHDAIRNDGFGPGNGTTTFDLPDMRGLGLIGAGTGAGGTYTLGLINGAATRGITTSNMPGHTHGIFADGDHTGHITSAGLVPIGSGADVADNIFTSPGNFANNTGATTSAGSGTSFDVRQPTMPVNFLVYI